MKAIRVKEDVYELLLADSVEEGRSITNMLDRVLRKRYEVRLAQKRINKATAKMVDSAQEQSSETIKRFYNCEHGKPRFECMNATCDNFVGNKKKG